MKDTISEHKNYPDNKKYCIQECDQKMQIASSRSSNTSSSSSSSSNSSSFKW